jgi:hypothetical protein
MKQAASTANNSLKRRLTSARMDSLIRHKIKVFVITKLIIFPFVTLKRLKIFSPVFTRKIRSKYEAWAVGHSSVFRIVRAIFLRRLL